MNLKEALLTLRSTPNGGEEACKQLLITSNRVAILMTGFAQKRDSLQNALNSSEGAALTASLQKAIELVPWFVDQKDLVQFVISITELRLEK